MTREEEKQIYYDYNPDDGQHWWRKEVPSAEPWFQEGLTAIAGLNEQGKPRLRLVWGETAMHDITYRPQKKYGRTVSITHGYNYLKANGEIGFARSMNEAVDAKEPWEFEPKKERLELGRLRWIVEKHVTAAELRAAGRFQNLYAPDGERILRELPPEGVYDVFFVIQTAAHKYRDPDREVLMAVEAMYHYNLREIEAQRGLDLIELENNRTLIGAEEARGIWQEISQ